jgi:hypothetical protein
MTDTLLDYDPNDTGEIRRPVGETRTGIDTGEKTVRIDPRLIKAPSFDAIPRRVIDLDDTVIYMPETIGCVDLDDKPHPKPPTLPPNPKYDMAAAQPVGPWERLVDTHGRLTLGAVAEVDGELRPAAYTGRHRDPQDRVAVPGAGQWGRLVEAAEPAVERIVEAVKPQGEPQSARVFVGVTAFVTLLAIVAFVVLVVFW